MCHCIDVHSRRRQCFRFYRRPSHKLVSRRGKLHRLKRLIQRYIERRIFPKCIHDTRNVHHCTGPHGKGQCRQLTNTAFTDVSPFAYYAPYIAWESSKCLISGTGNGHFSPNAAVTREQIAKILYTYAKSIVINADKLINRIITTISRTISPFPVTQREQ